MARTFRMTMAVVAMSVMAAAWPGVTAGQTAQPATLEAYAGVWEGVAQSPNGEVSLRATFKVQDGKFGGVIESSLGAIPVLSGAIADGKLVATIEFQGERGTLACLRHGDRVEGIWEVGDESGTFWLAPAGTATPAVAGGSIAGDWAGEVQIAGMAVPFTLLLRSGADGLSGEIGSPTGKAPLTSAVWKDGVLQLAFPYTAGEPVAMTGKLQDGKLVGEIDYNKGEAVGTWTAARKQ